MDRKSRIRALFDSLAVSDGPGTNRSNAYHRYLSRLVQRLVPTRSSIVELGSGTGDLLADLRPQRGLGIDISEGMVAYASARHPKLEFRVGDAESTVLDETFDTVLGVNLVGLLDDVYACFRATRRLLTVPQGRLVIVYYNHLWQPLLKLASILGCRTSVPEENWLPLSALRNILSVTGFDVIRSGRRMLCPVHIPVASHVLNTFVSPLPGIQHLCLIEYVVARPMPDAGEERRKPSCTIVIPTLNEKANIDAAIHRTSPMGSHTEYVFVDGHSDDGTIEEIERVTRQYPDRDIKFALQDGRGKADAVRKGFELAKGDIFMILDSDLTMPPEDLPKYYEVLTSGRAEFVNGCRLVYPMEKQAMRMLNKAGNYFFGKVFTWLMEQPVRDTLCGTKVLWREDYLRIAANREYFGDFDPFGDFDLLFGAARLNLKIVDLPIRYRARTYGEIKIARFRHGLLLLKMSVFGARKLKFI